MVDKSWVAVDTPIVAVTANEGDIPWIRSELKAMNAESGSTYKSLLPRDASVQVQILTRFIKNHPFFIAMRGPERVGFMFGLVTSHVLNPDLKVCYEALWWVPKKNRNTRTALVLLNAYEKFCKSGAVDWAYVTIHHNTLLAPRHLEKRGFTFIESSYRLEVNRGSSDSSDRAGGRSGGGGGPSNAGSKGGPAS